MVLEELVFVVDLTPEVMATCREEIAGNAPRQASSPPARPESPIRVVALLIDPDEDPVLLSIDPTDDVVMLDAMARLVRISLLYDRPFDELVRLHGDVLVQRLYREQRFPAFIYDGLPPAVRERFCS